MLGRSLPSLLQQAVASVLLLSVLPHANAATCAWTGAASAVWSGPNWAGCANPADGDSLIFPVASGGAFGIANTNDLGLLHLDSISVAHASGYTVNLNAVSLTGGISAQTGFHTLTGDITLDQPQTFSVTAGDTLRLDAAVHMNAQGLTLNAAGSLHANGVISSSLTEGLTLSGAGFKALNAANTFAGAVYLEAGTLSLGHATALGSTTNGTTVASGATLDVNGQNIAAEMLTLSGGAGVGNSGQLYSYGSSTWGGNVHLGSVTEIRVNTAAGVLSLSGPVSGGGISLMGPGTLLLSNTINSFSGPININTSAQGSTLRLGASGVIRDTAAVSFTNLLPLGTLDLNGYSEHIGSLEGTGNVTLGGGTLTVGGNGSDASFGGVISGSGSLVKAGPEEWTLSGANTFSGVTYVNGGTLWLNGGGVLGATNVASGATLTLSRAATIGDVQVASGGQLQLQGGTSIGHSGNLSLSAGATLSTDINNANPNIYGNMIVQGSVDLSGASLAINLGIAPGPGASFTLIDNDGSDAVIGSFAGLAQGASFAVGGTTLYMNYQGGDGNDVVISVNPPADPGPDPGPDPEPGPGPAPGGSISSVPTLSEWAMIALALLMVGSTAVVRRRAV